MTYRLLFSTTLTGFLKKSYRINCSSLFSSPHLMHNACSMGPSRLCVVSQIQHSNSQCHKPNICWKCDAEINRKKNLFFCDCGVIQPKYQGETYFHAFDLPISFNLDTIELARRYRNLQTKLHPDKFVSLTEKEQSFAENQSSFLNTAYSTLRSPYHRAKYLLTCMGQPSVDEDNTMIDEEFLFAVLQLNEYLADSHSHDEIVQFQEENNEHLNKLYECIDRLFQNQNYAEVNDRLKKLKYYLNIDEKIKERLV